MKKLLPFLMLLSLFLCTCTTGLGEEIDLEAPEITITSPKKNSFQKLTFTFEGTCYDNKGVTDIVISNNETGKIYGYGTINGENWKCDVRIPKDDEGEITFLCAANDSFGNSSTKSAKRIHLIVDETAPEGLAWYLNKNGKQIPLEEKSTLENLNFRSSKNKDIPQNEEFTIAGKMYDAMSILEVGVILRDENGDEVLSKTVKKEAISSGISLFNPSFTFTAAELIGKDSKYEKGKHYFHVYYRSKDNSNNEDTRELDWMLWYPESDKPGIEIGANDNDDLSTIRVVVGNSISANFFDDDGLTEVSWALRTSCDYTEDQIESDETIRNNVLNVGLDDEKGELHNENPIKFNYSATEKKTDYQCNNEIKVPTFPTKQGECLKLIVVAKDNKTKNYTARIVDVVVDDNSKPLLFVESPIENTIPEINKDTLQEFSIKGYTLDTKGCNSVKIVFVPNNIGYNTNKEKEDRAKVILANDTKSTGKETLSSKEMIWRKAMTPTNTDLNDDKYYEQPFEFKFDMLNGFNGVGGNEDKFFEIEVTDTDGNKVYRQFKITGDTIKPTIGLDYPDKNLAVVDYSTEDLVIKFKGTKDTGLGMKYADYKLIFEDEECTIANGKLVPYKDEKVVTPAQLEAGTVIDYVQFSKSKEWVQEYCCGDNTEVSVTKQASFELFATDVLGNETSEKLVLVLSPLPHITSITSDKPETTYKQGDKITLQANFSANVNVTGTPQLKVYYNDSDNEPKYADYIRGTGTKSLTFEFTVPAGAESKNGLCTKADNPIDLNGGTIKTAEIGDGDAHINSIPPKKDENGTIISNNLLQDSKKLKIDGISPYIASIKFTANTEDIDGKYYVTTAKTITASLTANEALLLSETPKLCVQSGTESIPFEFQSISNESKTLNFIYKVNSTSKEGMVQYNPANYFTPAALENIKDNAGNKLELKTGNFIDSNVIIDRTGPSKAPSINLTTGSYNKIDDLTLTPSENDGKVQYSLDEGVTWKDYTAAVKLEAGTHYIQTRQYDKAGNVSPTLETVKVILNDTFPLPTGLTIKKPDGKYKKDTEIKIALEFEDTVKGPNAGDVKLKIVPCGKESPEKIVESKAIAAAGSTKVEFDFTVSDTDSFEGIEIKEITFTDNFVDGYGNKPSVTTKAELKKLQEDETGSGGKRPGITLDGKNPGISSYSPANNGVYKAGNDRFTVTLTFDEPVFQESGSIILQRKGNWAIPAVMTGAEFLDIYNNINLTVAQKETLMATTNGNATGAERVDARTGIAVGPYRKITHGLKGTTTLTPDTDTKYVLDFNLGLYEGTTTLDKYASGGGITADVAEIRKVFEATGYHQHVMDVKDASVTVKDNVVTIVFANIEDGLEWELLIDEGAFIDATGNEFAGLKSGDYTVWSDKVATPIVRVDRYSHGYGAYEPDKDGKLTEITGYKSPSDKKNLVIPAGISDTNSGYNTKPTGYARVRIDCQTPGADIYYKIINKSSISISDKTGATKYYYDKNDNNSAEPKVEAKKTSVTFTNNDTNNMFTLSSNEDATKTELTFTSGGTEYENFVIVGDGLLTTARKDYVTAYAKKTNFTDSSNGYEGVFKTVICSAGRNGALNIEGGTAKGGEANVNGFPVKDATTDIRYSKNMYQENETDNYWISYEIISTHWAILQHRGNYSTNYPWSSYGEYTYMYKFSTWE